MLSIILTLACNDHYMAYPVDKVQDEEETINEPVDTIGVHDELTDTGDYEDTGYEEPIEETDEPIDTGYEEPIEETDDPVEVEEDTDTGSIGTTVPTDNFNYSDDFTVSKVAWSGVVHFATDYGYTMIDSHGHGSVIVCGLQPTGLIDCFCDNTNPVTNSCNSKTVVNHIPFQTYVDLSVEVDQVCAIDPIGSALCWDENGIIFNLPQVNPYEDIVSLNNERVCALDNQGSLYCFDTSTGGVVHSDANNYKAIEGKGSLVCGVLDSAETIECVNLRPVTNMNQSIYSVPVNHEIIGMDSDESSTCWTYLDGNGMQNVECYQFSTNQNQCLYSSPHQYYYDFFTNNVDLSNVEVGGMGAIYDSTLSLEVYWGGRYSGGLWQVVNNGYWTGSGCNYYWGN
jgi:hypothetical protein